MFIYLFSKALFSIGLDADGFGIRSDIQGVLFHKADSKNYRRVFIQVKISITL